jgi:hypothetical protein
LISASWQIEIVKPPEEVFDYIADLDHEPEWSPDSSNIAKKTDLAIGLGTVYTR